MKDILKKNEKMQGEKCCGEGVCVQGEHKAPQITYRTMTPADYVQVHALWERMQGFALRSLDDSREYVARFLERNPHTSVVAECVGEGNDKCTNTATRNLKCANAGACNENRERASVGTRNFKSVSGGSCAPATKIIGSILCGHDGRQAFFYHVCVAPEFRHHGVGREMVRLCLSALRDEKISKASLVAFSENEGGNKFWRRIGWTPRADFNTYEFMLNEENITRFVD